MNKEILLVVEAVSNEKDVPKEVIFEAMEAALASATRKKIGGDADARVAIDRTTGDYQAFRRWEVVEDPEEGELEAPERQIPLSEARRENDSVEVGDFAEEAIDVVLGGRIAAQAAKQVIVQKVREAERTKVVEAYQERRGELVTGIVK
jgi:N utilization substance protein A